MWIGLREENDRIIVNWKPITWYDKDGKPVSKDSKSVFSADFVPENEQSALFIDFDTGKDSIKNYMVDIKTKTLVKK